MPDPIHRLTVKYQHKWRNRGDLYRWWRLLQEVFELLGSILRLHRDPIDHELAQIGSIVMNWVHSRTELLYMGDSRQYYRVNLDTFRAYQVAPQDLTCGDPIVIRESMGVFRQNYQGGTVFQVQSVEEDEEYGAEVIVSAYDSYDEPLSEEITIINEAHIRQWMDFKGIGRKTAENVVALLGPLEEMTREDWKRLPEVDGIGDDREQSILIEADVDSHLIGAA